jgi:ISXO2-like transposase domain
VHMVSSLAKRWLLGTHQGSIDEAHLADYLDEFVFRFNRRRSRSRGLVFYRVLELAAVHDPVRYQRADLQPQARQTAPPAAQDARPSAQPRATQSAPALAPGQALLRLDGYPSSRHYVSKRGKSVGLLQRPR